MSKPRLLLLLVLAATAVAVTPGVANAAAEVTATCNGGACGGWHNTDVTVHWSWTDQPGASAGPECADKTLSSEGGNQTLGCTVTYPDNTVCDTTTCSGSTSVSIDKSNPTSSGPSVRSPDFGTWYNHPVAFDFHWSDPLSGLGAGCSPVTYNGANGSGVTVSSSCSDNAGHTAGAQSAGFNYDSAGPVNVAGGLSRLSDHNGWFNHPLTVAFTGTDPTSGISSCTSTAYSGPDSAGAAVPGSCTNGAGLTTAGPAAGFKYDDSPPTVSGASADRPPDHGDWYNHPVTFTFRGSDAASGIAACTSHSYSGPDDSTASMKGSCTDVAGNTANKAFSFKYDAHAPDKSKLYTVPANKAIDLSWVPPNDGASFTITRAPAVGATAATVVYQGSAKHFVDGGLVNGKKYNYVLTTYDPAGNSSTSGRSAVPDGSTLRPFIDTELRSPPRLSWARVRKARYYNIQLFKGRKKILSAWPKKANFQLRGNWRFNGKRVTLTPGLYRWYVWPGYGSMKRHRYGTLVGSSTFRFIK